MGRDPGRYRGRRTASEQLMDLRDDVVIRGVRLHGPRFASHVHEDDAGAGPRNQLQHAVCRSRGDVVDQIGSGGERGLRHSHF